MNPIGLSILTIVIVVVISAPRRWALLGMMGGVLYLTQGQEFDVAGFHLFAMRFVEVAGFIRVMMRNEFSFARLNRIDRGLLLLYGYATVVFLLRSAEGQAYQVGVAADAFFCYFTFRGLLQDMDELRWFLRAFLILLATYVMLVALERITGQNPFAFMGGVANGTWIREDKIRCFGSFRHPSLLGTLGASFVPLYIGLAFSKADRKLAFVGLGLCLAIVGLANSGGPVGALGAGFVAWLVWGLRGRMRLVRWVIVCLIGSLAIVMKAPIWYLIAHVSDITGGDGWHRAYLMDMAYQHLHRWWLIGMPIEQTSEWFPYGLPDTGYADITNQFVSFGIQAGLGAIALFILLLTRAFSSLGNALAAVRPRVGRPSEAEIMLWALGAVLITHVVNWLGITYFDQTYVIWFLQLAAISSLTDLSGRNLPQSEGIEERDMAQLEFVN